MKEEKPESLVAKKVQNEFRDMDQRLKGMHDKAVKGLHFFLKEVLGLTKYTININIDLAEVVIQPKTEDGATIDPATFDAESCSKMFAYLPLKLGVPRYTFRFTKKNEVLAEKNSWDE